MLLEGDSRVCRRVGLTPLLPFWVWRAPCEDPLPLRGSIGALKTTLCRLGAAGVLAAANGAPPRPTATAFGLSFGCAGVAPESFFDVPDGCDASGVTAAAAAAGLKAGGATAFSLLLAG